MSAELELTVLQGANDELGYLAGFVVTDALIVALGGTSNRAPTVLASSNARDFEPRDTPRALGLRDVIAVADSIWACGEFGQLAVTRDHGASWELRETGTDGCLFGLALAADGALWIVGDDGYAARLLGERVRRVDLLTTTRLSAVYAVRDELVVLGFDGIVRRWREGKVTTVACGATRPLTGLAITGKGTWIVIGDGGFIARSPDGQWYSRVHAGVDVDLEGIAALADGTLVVVGDRGQILISRDDGRSWRGFRNDLGVVHLWSVERFGGGLLIGGDDGLVLKLAPPGDATWAERADVFGGAKPLDAVFAPGPEGFIEERLAAYLTAIEEDEEEEGDDEEEDDDEDEEEEDDDDDDDDDDEEADDDEISLAGDGGASGADPDREAFALLGRTGTAEDFAAIYGLPLPAEARALFARVDGHDWWSSFEELRLDRELRPDVGDHNLFELLVRRNQHAYLGTDLVEAFAGVFGIGSQGNGDSYHLELYGWDAPRQVLHFDHETAAFSGVIADALDSLVYLAALVKAGDARAISKDTYAAGLRALYTKVAPTWHFGIDAKDDGFVALAPERRQTELLFHRARWICALLQHDGVVDVEDLPALFDAELNAVVTAAQLPARLEACATYAPTALYAMWRAYLFDEPELDRYLEVGRAHAARLVRDAATLIDELRAGRPALGTIRDWPAHLAAFRALDLDPRRAAARAAEAEARTRAEAARKAALGAELDRTAPSQWRDLAWRWLGDGVAHRALLERLDRAGEPQLAALDELRELRDGERAIVLPRLASELSGELEAVLVGSLVRGDDLAGVLVKPAGGPRGAGAADAGAPADADAAAEDSSPGWDAIDAALWPIYGDTEPHHYGTVLPYLLGGNDPLHGISAYARTEPVPHWHFVTYGFTDLYEKETDDPAESGFGFELTLRLAKRGDDGEPPMWALAFLQNLARYVFATGNRFAAGHKMGLNGPIALDHATQLTAVCFADDPELGEISSPYGRARFVQVVGITDDEYRLIQEWSTTGLLDILAPRLPYLVTDLARASMLADAATAAEVERRVAEEGSSEDLTFAGELGLDARGGRVRLELGALYAAVIPRAMRGRLRHGRPYVLAGRNATLHLRPAATCGHHEEDGELVLAITPALADELAETLRASLAGSYAFAAWPALEIVITPSIIRRADGHAIDVRGVDDPDAARALIAAENARLDAADGDHEGEAEADAEPEPDADADADADAEPEADAGADAELDADDAPPDPDRVWAALAMTERALRLAPDDAEVQLAHAMLLVEAERAGCAGRAGSGDQLLAWLARFAAPVRVHVAVRLGQLAHPRFGEAVELALGDALPAQLLAGGTTAVGEGAAIASFGDVAQELFAELGAAVLEQAPDRLGTLVRALPDDVGLLSDLAFSAGQAGQREAAIALYDRVLALPFPDDGDARTNYLRALNNACIQAHAAKAFEAAVRIAERAQPVAHENPYIYHSAACAYAAVGNYAKAFEQVKLAVEHEYDHLGKVEVDADLGPLLEWPEFKALFRDWHARQEGN